MSQIQLDNLTRRYGRRRGVERVSLSVPEGALFGFLGPNGAGKTTTIRVMLGFLRPTSGEARIFGLDCWRDSKAIKRDIGYLPGDLRLPAWMDGANALSIFGAVRGKDLAGSGRELAEKFDLDLCVKVRDMSRGMRQKLGLILALAFVLPKFGSQMSEQWLQLDFARGIMQAMLGTEIGDRIGPQMFQSIAWVHPVVLALTWAHALVSCTRVPAAEVDRGTADVLLGLPVSRWEVFISETVVWLVCGAAILAAALAGNLLGAQGLASEQRPQLSRLFIILANLFCLYAAVGGLAWLVSSFSDRRGRAMTILFLVLLSLFLLNYLAQFWHPLEKIAFLSPLHYHRPVNVLGNGVWPWRDMGVLLISGGAMWLTGGAVFARRDLCTV